MPDLTIFEIPAWVYMPTKLSCCYAEVTGTQPNNAIPVCIPAMYISNRGGELHRLLAGQQGQMLRLDYPQMLLSPAPSLFLPL